MPLEARVIVDMPIPPGLDAIARSEFITLRSRVRVHLRNIANDLRRDLRAAAPRRTNKLYRNIRVRSAGRLPVVGYAVQANVFYGAASNARGSSQGWWDGTADTLASDRLQARIDAASLELQLQSAARRAINGNRAMNTATAEVRRSGFRVTGIAFRFVFFAAAALVELVVTLGTERDTQ